MPDPGQPPPTPGGGAKSERTSRGRASGLLLPPEAVAQAAEPVTSDDSASGPPSPKSPKSPSPSHPASEFAADVGWPSNAAGGDDPVRRSSIVSIAESARQSLRSFTQMLEEEGKKGSVFVNADQIKESIRKNLHKEQYDVAMYYKPDGLWRTIALSPLFEKITLAVIAANACWIGIDTDYNSASILLDADPLFQIGEHAFCIFFVFEWFVRFSSFAEKTNTLRDAWFVFDTILVFLMVAETWALTTMMLLSGAGSANGIGNASILRMARLARLTRMTRMARLLRAMPELMILIKGIVAATRSVFFTLMLLCLLLYVFGIAFTQLTVGMEVGDTYFSSVAQSMFTLLVFAALMDQISEPLDVLVEESPFCAALYLLFVLLGTVTLMNMLIGVLCEVVSAMAATEKESLLVSFVKSRLQSVLSDIDENGDNVVTKAEFKAILESRDAIEALSDVGVDVVELVDFADFIFANEESPGEEKTLEFGDFMDVVLQFRGSNNATVKDVVDLRKIVQQKLQHSSTDMTELRRLICEIMPAPRADRRPSAEKESDGAEVDEPGPAPPLRPGQSGTRQLDSEPDPEPRIECVALASVPRIEVDVASCMDLAPPPAQLPWPALLLGAAGTLEQFQRAPRFRTYHDLGDPGDEADEEQQEAPCLDELEDVW